MSCFQLPTLDLTLSLRFSPSERGSSEQDVADFDQVLRLATKELQLVKQDTGLNVEHWTGHDLFRFASDPSNHKKHMSRAALLKQLKNEDELEEEEEAEMAKQLPSLHLAPAGNQGSNAERAVAKEESRKDVFHRVLNEGPQRVEHVLSSQELQQNSMDTTPSNEVRVRQSCHLLVPVVLTWARTGYCQKQWCCCRSYHGNGKPQSRCESEPKLSRS